MDPSKRLSVSDLVELARKTPEFSHTMTLDKIFQLLNELKQMATFYANRGQDEERAFVFFLRYISIVVEELPKHPCFSAISSAERLTIDIRTLECIGTAEQLKRRIKLKYEREKEELAGARQTTTAHEQYASTSRATTMLPHSNIQAPVELDHLMVPDLQLSPYVRCQLVSVQPIVFQRVIIPNNIPELFLSLDSMDGANGVRFALLYGRLVSKSVIVSQLLPCSLDTFSGRNYRRFVPDPDPESTDDLPIVGCICSSLPKACQSGFFRFCLISEMVCIVCPPGPNRTILLHLVNMSPSGGSPAHPSSQSSSGLPCAHQHITDSITAGIVRNVSQQNGNDTQAKDLAIPVATPHTGKPEHGKESEGKVDNAQEQEI